MSMEDRFDAQFIEDRKAYRGIDNELLEPIKAFINQEITRAKIEVLGETIDEHRKQSFITCAPECFCWEAENKLEALQKELL